MKTAVHSVVAMNLLMYVCYVAVVLVSFDTMQFNRWLGIITIGSWGLLLAVSTFALFVDRELASLGFIVVVVGLVIGILSPAL